MDKEAFAPPKGEYELTELNFIEADETRTGTR